MSSPGITPSRPERPFTDQVATRPAGLDRLDPDLLATGSRPAGRDRLDPDLVATGADSMSLILRLFQAVCEPGDHIVFTAPSRNPYTTLAHRVDAVANPVALYRQRQELDDMLATSGRQETRMIVIANPHPPTGTAPSATDLEDFLEAIPTRVVVLLDETSRTVGRHPDLADGLRFNPGCDYDNLVVLRSMPPEHSDSGHGAYLVAGARIAAAVRAASGLVSVAGGVDASPPPRLATPDLAGRPRRPHHTP